MRVNLPAIGQAYLHEDVRLSAQTCKNWRPEINNETSTVISLQPWHGAKLFASGSGIDRGVTKWNGLAYKVTGTTLSSITSVGGVTTIGTIGGSSRCNFAGNSDYLVITTGGLVYVYDGLTLTQNTSAELEAPNYTTYLNEQWIYQGKDGRFGVSDAGNPFSINALNYATAESDGDNLIRPYVYKQVVYMFGGKTIEQWYNSGVGTPPFDRIEGGIIQKGLGAAESIAENDNFLYFLGDDCSVYQLVGSQVRNITTPALGIAFAGYADPSSAVAYTLTLEAQEYYIIKFNEATWAFSESAGGWFELTAGNNERPYPATDHVYIYGKHLLADEGNLLELDRDLNTYNGLPMIKERTTGTITGALIGQEGIGKKIFMSRMEVWGKCRASNNTDPVIMIDYSRDGGLNYSNPKLIQLPKNGNYEGRLARVTRMGSFYDRVIRYRVSDDVQVSLHRASGDVTFGSA